MNSDKDLGSDGDPDANGVGPSYPQEVHDLCELLAGHVEAHRRGQDRPAVTAAWLRDMDLLRRRGPAGIATPGPLPDSKIRAGIGHLFEHMALTDRGGFCWADQVRSPGALRRHWTKLGDAFRRERDRRLALALDEVTPREALHQVVRERTCAGGTCDGSGWLERPFDPWRDGPEPPAEPCPHCRPDHAAAVAQGG